MKHAVIYIPGLQQAWLPQSVDVISDLLVAALNRTSRHQGSYRISADVAQVRLANRDQVAMRTIERLSGNHWRPMIDIYEMGYTDIYAKVQRNRGLLTRFLFMIFVNLCNAVALWRSNQFLRRQRSKTDNRPQRDLRRWVLSSAVFGACLLYAIILGYAVLDIVMSVLDKKHFPDWLAISSTIFLVVGPKFLSENLTGKLANLFTDNQSNMEYFWQWRWMERLCKLKLIKYMPEAIFDVRASIFARMRTLMSYVREQPEPYRTIQILAYSQGTIIAVDTLFPVCGKPLTSATPPSAAQPMPKAIDRLLTLGFPSRWVSNTWKGYFDRPKSSPLQLKTWTNFHFCDDALGGPVPSELIDIGVEVQDRELPIDYQSVKLPEWVRWLSSIQQAHMAYFGISKTTSDLFEEIATIMFPEDEAIETSRSQTRRPAARGLQSPSHRWHFRFRPRRSAPPCGPGSRPA